MLNKILTIFLFLWSLHSTLTWAEVKKESDDAKDSFKSTKFLHIDKFEIPTELEVISDQISQNAIDVIILTGKYTVTYTSQLPTGYNKSYLNFYSLKISIHPKESDSQSFALKLFLYNWTTKKYDQTLVRSISKYNVLNEVRMAMYEMILGKNYVINQKDKLEKNNFERIQSVRMMIEKNKKKNGKQSQINAKKALSSSVALKESDKEQAKLKRSSEKSNSKISTPVINSTSKSLSSKDAEKSKNYQNLEEVLEKQSDLVKNNNSSSSNKLKKNPPVINEAVAPRIEIATKDLLEEKKNKIPVISEFKFLSGYSFEKVETVSILPSTTNLKYINLGASFFTESQTRFPWGYDLLMKAGIPIKKDDYQLSVTKQFSGALSARFYSFLRFQAIVEYSSLPFVNLVNAGADIKTIQNDLLYVGGGGKIDFDILNKKSYLGFDLLKSLFNKSSQNKSIQTSKSNAHLCFQMNEQSGFILSYFSTKISGAFSGHSSGANILYTYSFGK